MASNIIESIFYGASRGFWRAYWDVMRDQARVDKEITTNEDHDRASRFRVAVERVSAREGQNNPRQNDTPSPYPWNPPVDHGEET